MQESGYGEAAVKLQRDWNLDPQSLSLAKHVKGRALIRLVQRGLEHYYLEQTVVHGIEYDQIQPSMLYFGPDSVQSRRPSPQVREVQKDRSPSVATSGTGSTRKHGRENVPNGVLGEMTGQPAPKRSRKIALNGVTRNGEPIATTENNAMDVDQPNGSTSTKQASATKSPSSTPVKADMDVDVEADVKTTVSAGLAEDENALHANASESGLRASSLDAPVDQDQEPSKPVAEDASEAPVIHTLTNGHSVEVQTTPAKVAELEGETTVLNSPYHEHVTKALWRPKDSTVLASMGYDFCGIWNCKQAPDTHEHALSPQYHSLLDKVDGVLVSALAWEPNGSMLAVSTYNELSGELRIYDGAELELVETLPAAQKLITTLKWQNVGSRLVGSSTGQDFSLVVWDLNRSYAGESSIQSIPIPDEIYDVDWASHGNVSIACAAGRGVVYQCRATSDFSVEHKWMSDSAADHVWQFIKCSWWSEESSIAIAATSENATLWIPTRDIVQRDVHAAPITGLELRPVPMVHPNQHAIHDFITASLDGTVKVWRYNDQIRDISCLFKLAMGGGSESPILAVKFSPDGSYIAAASYNQLKIWDSNTGGVPVATWDSNNMPELGWKGQQEKESRLNRPNGITTDKNENMDADEADLEHSLSWDAEGKRIAFGLGQQLALVSFKR